MADGFVAIMLQSQREVEEGSDWGKTLLAEELVRMARPQPTPAEAAEPLYAKMVGWIEGWSGAIPLAHVRLAPCFPGGAGLGCISATRGRDHGYEVLVDPDHWQAILQLDGLEKLDTTEAIPKLAGLPIVETHRGGSRSPAK